MYVSFTKELINPILAFDNHRVKDFLQSRGDLIRCLRESMLTMPPALSVSARCGNLQAICILLQEGWTESFNTSLNTSVEEGDFSKAHLLMSFGFDTSCDDCHDCGFPNTCALTKIMSSYNKRSPRKREILRFWCRSHSEKDVYVAFSRFLAGRGFSRNRAYDVMSVMDETGNNPGPYTFSLTRRNIGFVMEMNEKGRVNLDSQLHRVVMEMVDHVYSTKVVSPRADLRSLYEVFKRVVDAGACFDETFIVEATRATSLVLPAMERTRKMSVRDVVNGFTLSERDTKRAKMKQYMDMCSSYLRVKSRRRFIVKRIRGVDPTCTPEFVEEILVQMPSEVFGRIMGFLF